MEVEIYLSLIKIFNFFFCACKWEREIEVPYLYSDKRKVESLNLSGNLENLRKWGI